MIESLTSLAEIYPNHLWIEDFLLFPMVNKLLNGNEQMLLGQRLDRLSTVPPSEGWEMAQRVGELESTAAALIQNTTSRLLIPHEHAGPERMPEATSGTAIEFSLNEEAERLRQEPAWAHGRNAKTIIKFSDLRVVLTAIRAGQTLSDHRNPSRTYIQSLSGHIRVEALGKPFDLPAGHVVALDRDVPQSHRSP